MLRAVTILIFFSGLAASPSLACDYYASPNGTGNGLSPSTPFKIANFWSVAAPGKTLCLLDGVYKGTESMIDPPDNLSGTAGHPITIRALNDGGARIDGEGVRRPVLLNYNDYFVLEGFNAHSSSGTVVAINRSNNTIVRRVAAWDAADSNTEIFGAHWSTNTLFEDVAGWGIARKIFQGSQGGNYLTCRRCWGRWEGSHVVGPKMTYTLAYNNYYMTVENSIGTWSGEKMKKTYVLLDYKGQPWTGNGAGTYTNYDVNQPYGIFAVDANPDDPKTYAKILGSIAYVTGQDRFHARQLYFVTKLDYFDIINSVAYIQPGTYTGTMPFALYNLSSPNVAVALVANSLTGFGSTASIFSSQWRKTNVVDGATPPGNIYTSSSGAQICKRYKDGVLTNEPLWPWPMNQRILDAMVVSGRQPVDVTRTIEQLFGPIPAECKSVSSTPLMAPSDLRVTQAN